jgi:hypothetical protein
MSFLLLSLALLSVGLKGGASAGEKFAAALPNLPTWAYPTINGVVLILALMLGFMNGAFGLLLGAFALGWSFRSQGSWLVVIAGVLVVAYQLLLAAATEAAGVPFTKSGADTITDAASSASKTTIDENVV